jgi:hypothetical protein
VSQTHLHLRRRLALIAPPEGCGCNTISNASGKVKSIRRNRTAKRIFYPERVRWSVDHLVENKLDYLRSEAGLKGSRYAIYQTTVVNKPDIFQNALGHFCHVARKGELAGHPRQLAASQIGQEHPS